MYMLLCRDEQSIYIKVGQTTRPENRFHQLRNNCPVTPRSFSVVPVPGPTHSRKLERSLRDTFDKWRVAGEWFRMDASDKQEFNQRLHVILGVHSKPLWPMKITKISVGELIKMAENRRRYWRSTFSRRGAAYQDFVKEGGLAKKN